MTTYNIRKLRAGRIADENPATWVGQQGTIFYNEATGALRISDGVTPGGVNLPFAVASTTEVGGIKAGPGANVSVDGTLTIDTAGLPLGIGNISIIDNIISTVNADADIILESNGTGNVELVGNVHFHTTAQGPVGTPFFNASSDGQITILVPAADPLAGAVKIVGSSTGRVFPPLNTGVMLQLTGNNNDPSRLYNDGIGNFAAFVGRRVNGNLTVPTAVQAGDEIIRISSTGHNGNTVPGSGSARILYTAKETYTTSAAGTNLSIWTTAIGSTALTKTATFDRETGLTVAGNLAVSGTITGQRTYAVRNAGAVNGGSTLTLDWSTDSMVCCTFSADISVGFANIQPGRVITLAATNTSAGDSDVVTIGVNSINTQGDNTITVTEQTTAMITYYSYGTSTGNIFVSTVYN